MGGVLRDDGFFFVVRRLFPAHTSTPKLELVTQIRVRNPNDLQVIIEPLIRKRIIERMRSKGSYENWL
jgi:hypothetical protein